MKKYILIIFALTLSLNSWCETLEKQAAKLLIVGMKGTSLNDDNPVICDVAERGVSGVIFFEHNIESKEKFKALISDLQALREDKILMCIDQEGGRVNRMKEKYGFPTMLSAESVSHSDTLARENAQTIASELKQIGINLNFAPCLDVNINPQSPAIGAMGRSFSNDENIVSQLAEIYIKEHHKQGILTSLKHFPGHGSALKDSHLGFTDITLSWAERELEPYKYLIDKKLCDMVMVSHLFNEKFDKNHPATLSSAMIDSLLRKELGFKGVVISDDMQMKAITSHYTFEKAIIRALNAGVDLFIISSNIAETDYSVSERFINTIVSAVETGEISKKTLNKAVNRVEKLLNRIE
ncbi:MAG: beta-N-acetylhexosaminidase [Rikenellaceae bacterium]